jgi:hypothetical protein
MKVQKYTVQNCIPNLNLIFLCILLKFVEIVEIKKVVW